ncbi:oligosaccharide flippase family protein [Sulfuricurvum sp.]|uniref:lipopolysaccharide biosynthesis protein n=2 Tax=Sulfuricurvum sp. TaxID=2025608 RepID=UPI002610F473|nr:oligosaccharide flippase family protein [Sulfuricurvum sp.]MDD2837792.1 oligosaccharide flippase family protein [Sulfuricurvum sp.]MDD4883650.1 oligosaccharide flippase family protein [Sulfuricurvum sp.]
MSLRKTYSKNLITSYFLILLGIVIPIIMTPFILGKLGAELYGLWILMNTIVSYFYLSNLGLNTAFTKEISGDINTSLINTLISTMTFFFVGVIVFVSIVTLIIFINLDTFFSISVNHLETSKLLLLIFFVNFSIGLVSSIFDSILFARQFLFLSNIIRVISLIMTTSVTVFLLLNGYSIIALAISNLAISAILSTVMYLYTRKIIDFSIHLKDVDIQILKKLFKPSIYYFLISIGVTISFYSDTLVISSVLGLAAVAVYSIAQKVVSISEKILFKITDIMFPDIAKLFHEENYDEIKRLHNRTMLISVSLAILGYGTLFFIGPWLIKLWIGDKLQVDMDVFNILLLFSFIHTWNHVSSVFVMAMGLHKEVAWVVLIEAVLNVFLSVLFAKAYGLPGIAMGTLIAHAITNNWFTPYWFYRNLYLLKGRKNG